MSNTISRNTYRAADRRIRRGEEQEMDLAICDGYQLATYGQVSIVPVPRTIWDLPVARALWAADCRQLGES